MKHRLLALALCATVFCTGCSLPLASIQQTSWEAEANLTAEETAQQLYEQALSEETLTIYTVSSRIFDVAESFSAAYPGLYVDVQYKRIDEIVEALETAGETGEYTVDLIYCTNGDGSVTDTLIPSGLAYAYLPYDMQDTMREGLSDAYTSVIIETPLIAYNSNVYDAPPITNWWELTEPAWENSFYITDPSVSMISYTLFATMHQNAALLEEAYLERYGTALMLAEGENAFEVFLRALIDNGMQVMNDSDDVADAIAKPNMESGAVGLLNASKLRLNDSGYTLAMCYDVAPFAGVMNAACIMVAGGAPSTSSAKLFIRWILGESDGQGEGYTPFLQEGTTPARSDVAGVTPALETVNAIYTDEAYTSAYRDAFLETWALLLAE